MRPLIVVSEETAKRVCEEYREGRSFHYLSHSYAINKRIVKRILVERGVQIRPASDKRGNEHEIVFSTTRSVWIPWWR